MKMSDLASAWKCAAKKYREDVRILSAWRDMHVVNRFRGLYQRLSDFEDRYGMVSGEFYRKFEAHEIHETPDFLRWRSTYCAYKRMIDQYGVDYLEGVIVSERELARSLGKDDA